MTNVGPRPIPNTLSLLERERSVIGDCMRLRMYPFAVGHSEGCRLWDPDGNEYVDWMGCAGVAAAGYRHPTIRAAIDTALDEEFCGLIACYGNEPAVDLAERLVQLCPGTYEKRVWFGLSGSDAMDCLAKLLPLAAARPRLVCFTGGFAGMTIGSAAISGHHSLAGIVGPGTVTKAPYPDPKRCTWGPCAREGCSLNCVRYLREQVLTSVSPASETAAIIIEAVQSDNGEVVPPANVMPALRALCDEFGIWLVVDEIKSGLGRTGRMFAFEHSGVVPDAIALGKALGGGLPLSAVVARREILDAPAFTAYSAAASPVACRAALANLDVIAGQRLTDNAAAMGAYFREEIDKLRERHPIIGEVRGEGLLIGIELEQDSDPLTAAKVVYRCFQLGLLLLYCGADADVLEITPPLTVTRADVDAGMAVLDAAVGDVERGSVSDSHLDGFAGW